MNASSRTVRVFLSSTFRDFAEERDLLVRKVFPELRRRCRERQVELVDVDLRWGITEAEAQQGRVLPICLAEIDRSRPYFMAFLGERYGWVPKAEEYDRSLTLEQPWLEEHRGGKSVTELEILHGVLNNPKMAGRAFFYFRDPKWVRRRGQAYRSEGPAHEARLKALKDRIRKSGFPVVENYPGPGALAERVKEDLWKLIDEAYPVSEVPDALTLERRRHEAYGAVRLRMYLGGEKYFAALDAALRARKFQPVLVTGASGGGKSALLANWVARWSRKRPKAAVIVHHLGCGADAADPVSLTTRLMRELARVTGEVFKPDSDPEKQLEQLPQWLALASAWAAREGREVVLVLDGLDKVSDRRHLRWFPSFLPPGIKLVASCLDGDVLEAARSRLGWRELKVKPLTKAEQREFIQQYLGRFRKGLTSQQARQVQGHPLSGNPLFLLTVLEELRVFGVHEGLDQRLRTLLSLPPGKRKGEAPTVDDVFEHVLARVEGDVGRKAVQAVMEALWASRAGLFQDELLAIAKVAPAAWAEVRNALDESLYETGGRIGFGHDYLRKAVEDRYGLAGRRKQQVHWRLAGYFQRRPVDVRVAEELPWQWEQAGEKVKLRHCLTGFEMFWALRSRGEYELLGYWVRLGIDAGEQYQRVAGHWKRAGKLTPELQGVLDDFLWSTCSLMVVSDFGAMIVSALSAESVRGGSGDPHAGPCKLLAALRPGGTVKFQHFGTTWRSHVMGAWGFLMTEHPNSQLSHLEQWHIPRYPMAHALRQQDHFFYSESYRQPTLAEWMPIPTLIHGRNKLSFLFRRSSHLPGEPAAPAATLEFPLAESFVLQMKQDLALLESAISQVAETRQGVYSLPGFTTCGGYPVEAGNRVLVEAIAFERACYPKLSAANFGIYSAYCTHRDGEANHPMPEPLLQELLQAQFGADPEELGDELHALLVRTQLEVLGEVVWARGVRSSLAEAVPRLARGMAGLTPFQRTQFVLMNGMHGTGLLLPLAVVAGACSFRRYADLICQGLQPDSPEEQDARIEAAYIDLFGRLCADPMTG